ncbi:MAG: ester cyclase [Cyclobacteriaceae bacterium]|nr:ester cyclase [Cyclobacteriaceae bacterium]
MSQLKKNKAFIVEYMNALSGQEKTREKLEKYNADPRLIDYIMFIDSIFPKYEVNIEEMLAEDDKVIVRVRFRGMHEGEIMGFPATHKWVEYPFVVRYQIKDRKITHSWVIADNLVLAEAIGLKRLPSKHPK